MKKIIPVILKGLGILIVVGCVGYGIFMHLNSDTEKINVLRAQNTELMNELNQIKQEKINEERRKMQKQMDDLAFQNTKLTKELQKLQKEKTKNSNKSF